MVSRLVTPCKKGNEMLCLEKCIRLLKASQIFPKNTKQEKIPGYTITSFSSHTYIIHYMNSQLFTENGSFEFFATFDCHFQGELPKKDLSNLQDQELFQVFN